MENKVGISAADRGMICPLCGRSAGEHEIAVTPTATGLHGEKAGLPSAADLDADAAEKQVGDDTK